MYTYCSILHRIVERSHIPYVRLVTTENDAAQEKRLQLPPISVIFISHLAFHHSNHKVERGRMKSPQYVGALCILVVRGSLGFQNLFTSFSAFKSPLPARGSADLENQLLKAIDELGDNRLANDDRVTELVLALEKTKSIPAPAVADEVYGRWKLIHTNNANTASPIQRKAVDSSRFAIYQDIVFNDKNQLVVSQVVKFSETAELKVDALASTSAYPLAELTERRGDGRILGLNILGVSKVGDEAEEDKGRPDSRINFVFDEGNFELGGLKIPYPVPFRLPVLRDAVKGWIDITYMSDRVRVSRGNKGTAFVLVKEDPKP
jgi:PAP_fibrillin